MLKFTFGFLFFIFSFFYTGFYQLNAFTFNIVPGWTDLAEFNYNEDYNQVKFASGTYNVQYYGAISCENLVISQINTRAKYDIICNNQYISSIDNDYFTIYSYDFPLSGKYFINNSINYKYSFIVFMVSLLFITILPLFMFLIIFLYVPKKYMNFIIKKRSTDFIG